MLKAPVYPTIVFEERPAAREELLREYERKRNDFNTAFSTLVQTEIHPALHRFLDDVRRQGHHLELDAATQEKFEQYPHRSYSIRLRGHARPVVFTFAGNFDHRKVFIYTEFNESTTINVYDPAQINEPLMERIVLKGLGKIVSAA